MMDDALQLACEDGMFTVRAETRLPLPVDRVFPFFADAANLEQLTPAWIGFRIVTPRPIEMKVGTRIDYQIRLHGVPVPWRTLISAWEPPHRFVDEQLFGPYRTWIHEHTFEADGHGTICRDLVRYRLWAPPGVDRLLNRYLVASDLRRIFGFRAGTMKTLLGSPARVPHT